MARLRSLRARLVGGGRRGPGATRAAERGQVLVLFSIMAAGLIGAVAVVTDVSWLWVNQQRMQRAADAAALAGSVYLPGDPAAAYAAALAESSKNGFTNGAGGIVVTPRQDTANPRRLNVRVSGPVGTYFARVFCVSQDACLESVPVAAASAAEYTLPVPMGSPQSYYGVGYLVAPVTSTSTETFTGTTAWSPTGLVVSGGTWTNAGQARVTDGVYATSGTNGQNHQWTSFGLLTGTGAVPNETSLAILGIEVRLAGVSYNGTGTATSCQVRVELSPDAGATWSSPALTPALAATATANRIVGSTTSTAAWGARTWRRTDLSDSALRVRLTWIDGTSGCASTQNVRLDGLEVRVSWRYDRTTTSTTWQQRSVVAPDGTVLAPQNFWGAMQSQGAPSTQGDIYMSRYDARGSSNNPSYAPEDYHNYAVEVPAGATNGEVWIFDPGFCDARRNYGTGESWAVGGTNGNATAQAVSSYYDLYDTRETPYDRTDDSLVASSGTLFQRISMYDRRAYQDVPDPENTPPGAGTTCEGQSWHFGWWRLASGLSGGPNGRTYRVHTYSTERANPSGQLNATALNAFAIWSKATGGSPRVYGIGSMQTFVRLPPSTTSEFYLAQVDAVHAGKTLEIALWDPGDTGQMSGTLEILMPTGTGYAPVSFAWSAAPGSTASGVSACAGTRASGVTSVVTNSGGSSFFNGCWLTISVVIPLDYTAPRPLSDTVTAEGGWWKIRYRMGAAPAGTDTATDVATWQVQVKGSPVHLVP